MLTALYPSAAPFVCLCLFLFVGLSVRLSAYMTASDLDILLSLSIVWLCFHYLVTLSTHLSVSVPVSVFVYNASS